MVSHGKSSNGPCSIAMLCCRPWPARLQDWPPLSNLGSSHDKSKGINGEIDEIGEMTGKPMEFRNLRFFQTNPCCKKLVAVELTAHIQRSLAPLICQKTQKGQLNLLYTPVRYRTKLSNDI